MNEHPYPHLPSVALGGLAAGVLLLIAALFTALVTGQAGSQPSAAAVAATLAIAGLAVAAVASAAAISHHLIRHDWSQ